mmetsp:Transcript_61795/g.75763  ORF Transcript_61795/g.75763 Transcript_61795/m.75763 type:complete len:187 (-) Transcript_61795:33-593(-)
MSKQGLKVRRNAVSLNPNNKPRKKLKTRENGFDSKTEYIYALKGKIISQNIETNNINNNNDMNINNINVINQPKSLKDYKISQNPNNPFNDDDDSETNDSWDDISTVYSDDTYKSNEIIGQSKLDLMKSLSFMDDSVGHTSNLSMSNDDINKLKSTNIYGTTVAGKIKQLYNNKNKQKSELKKIIE